ncbi:MAG: tetratricopeptide repeat protein, partial [Candidatus Riflebacteria bacterium]|nr:tetratricopeptide repeat protein [Candidatus Riflebacteria bacterium]
AALEREALDEALRHFLAATTTNPKCVAGHLGVGRAQEELGNLDGAVQAYRHAIEIAPGSSDAPIALARLLANRRGRLADAHKILRNVTGSVARRVDALMELADLLVRQGEWKEAETVLVQVTRLEPGNLDGIARLARIKTLHGAFSEALALLAGAAGSRTPSSRTTLAKAFCFGKSGESEKARAQILEALSQAPESAPDCENMALVLGLDDLLTQEIGRFYRGVHDLGGASSRLVGAAAEFLVKPRADPDRRWLWYGADSVTVVRILEKLKELHPEDPRLPPLLALAYQADGRAGSAQVEYQKDAQEHPNSPAAARRLTRFLVSQRQLDEAETLLRGWIARSPRSFDAHFEYGRFLQIHRRDPARADGEYRRASEGQLLPRHLPAIDGVVRYFLRRNLPELAARGSQAALRLNPESAVLTRLRGAALVDLGRPDEAMAAFRREAEILGYPTAGWAHFRMADRYIERREFRAAIPGAQAALKLGIGKERDALVRFAEILSIVGEKAAAAAVRPVASVGDAGDAGPAAPDPMAYLESLGRIDDAELILRERLRRPADPGERWRHTTEAMTWFERRGRPAEALTLLRQTPLDHPDDSGLCQSAVDSLISRGRPADAERALRDAFRRHPFDAAFQEKLFELLNDAWRFKDVEAFAREVLELEAGAGLALLNLGMALQMQKKRSEAIATYQRLVDQAEVPGPILSRVARQLLSLGRLDDGLRAFGKACRARDTTGLQAVLDAVDKHVDAPDPKPGLRLLEGLVALPELQPAQLLRVGDLASQKGRLDQAENAYTRALHIGKDPDPWAYASVGYVWFRQGKRQEADAAFRQAISGMVSRPNELYAFADYLNRLGNATLAREARTKVHGGRASRPLPSDRPVAAPFSTLSEPRARP